MGTNTDRCQHMYCEPVDSDGERVDVCTDCGVKVSAS